MATTTSAWTSAPGGSSAGQAPVRRRRGRRTRRRPRLCRSRPGSGSGKQDHHQRQRLHESSPRPKAAPGGGPPGSTGGCALPLAARIGRDCRCPGGSAGSGPDAGECVGGESPGGDTACASCGREDQRLDEELRCDVPEGMLWRRICPEARGQRHPQVGAHVPATLRCHVSARWPGPETNPSAPWRRTPHRTRPVRDRRWKDNTWQARTPPASTSAAKP